MMNCLQFGSIVAFLFNLRRYTAALQAKAAKDGLTVDVTLDPAMLAEFAKTAGKPIQCQAAVAGRCRLTV